MGEKGARRILTLTGSRGFGGWNKEVDPAEETGWSYQGSGEEPGGCPGLEAKGRKSFGKGRGSGLVGGSTFRRTPISQSPLDKNPMPGHLSELHPVNEVNTKGLFHCCIGQSYYTEPETVIESDFHCNDNGIYSSYCGTISLSEHTYLLVFISFLTP